MQTNGFNGLGRHWHVIAAFYSALCFASQANAAAID
jgi:hypothetical protein